METINDFEQLRLLPFGEKFYVITEGSIRSYLNVGKHPRSEKLTVAIWDADYTTAKVFSANSFGGRTVFLKGKYDSAVVGGVMIAQLEAQIKTVETVYLTPKK